MNYDLLECIFKKTDTRNLGRFKSLNNECHDMIYIIMTHRMRYYATCKYSTFSKLEKYDNLLFNLIKTNTVNGFVEKCELGNLYQLYPIYYKSQCRYFGFMEDIIKTKINLLITEYFKQSACVYNTTKLKFNINVTFSTIDNFHRIFVTVRTNIILDFYSHFFINDRIEYNNDNTVVIANFIIE
jgi:hypothetical protein